MGLVPFVDDLRRPQLHTIFGVEAGEGLTTVLLSENATLPLVETPAPGVRLLASGPVPANPLRNRQNPSSCVTRWSFGASPAAAALPSTWTPSKP